MRIGEVADAVGVRVRRVYALLDELADAAPDDPRVGEAARALAGFLPGELPEGEPGAGGTAGFLRAFYADFAPAQAEAIRQAMRQAGCGRWEP